VHLFPRREMLDLVAVNGQTRGIIARNLVSGEIERHEGHAVVLCTGGYGNVYFLSTNAKACNVTATFRHTSAGFLRQPLLHPDSSHLHPGARHLPVQADPDEREPAQRRPGVGSPDAGDKRPAKQIPEAERDYFLERKYPSFGNLVPRDVASRNAKEQCDLGKGVGETGLAVYLDFATPSGATAVPRFTRNTATSFKCTKRSPARTLTRRP